MYGINVRIKMKVDSPFGAIEETLHNVTEIHYRPNGHIRESDCFFESDIHGTGISRNLNEVEEFETIEAKKIHKNF